MEAYKLARALAQNTATQRLQLSSVEASVADLRGQQLSLQQQIASLYQKMATVLLQESSSVHVDEQSIQTLLQQLNKEIDLTRQQLAAEEQRFQQRQRALVALDEQIDQHEAERDSQLAADPLAEQARVDKENFAIELEKQTLLHAELEAEVAEKTAVYGQQKLFNYLLEKGYATEKYHAWRLRRNLDNWIAGLCRFNENAANYRMLFALQKASETKLQTLEQQAAARDELFRGFVSRVEKDIGLPELYQRLEALEAKLTVSQQKVSQLQLKIQAFASGEGENFQRIMRQLSEQMSRLPQQKLSELVARTASPDDDIMLERIRTLIPQEASLTGRIAAVQTDRENARKDLGLAEALESAFHRNGLNNDDLEFKWGLFDSEEKQIRRYMNGEQSLREILAKISAASRKRPRPAPASSYNNAGSSRRSSSGSGWTSRSSSGTNASRASSGGGFSASSGGSSSSSGTSSGGGFSSSSSTGGGSYRTTDSF
ncbi:hypothetical protein F3J28_04565 [Enterobacter sp. Ap-1006]|uniref:hypothetical protein n=1 Tax=Enterobacter sp. Ap-1006 TaxID=2608345 RepID=UPI00141E94C8|nr:hypothetical protein [Enterobacter sp. Ap-1006]NIF47041.1 hypothetical protein [Enterobacter sp. Ap-1006]